MARITRALVSVSDKTGIVAFAKGLKEFDVEIISTGGTARMLAEAGIGVTQIDDYTGFPEMMDGRVKTLHPKVHGGLLGIRDNSEHTAAMDKHGILPIDMVVVNLYPFEATIAKPGVELAEAIENIDIGGPSMVRSAAKNNKYVAVVTNPDRYGDILNEMKDSGGELSQETLFLLASEAFALTSHYDSAIADYFEKQLGGEFPPSTLRQQFKLAQKLRYGENPHQRAAFYRQSKQLEPSISTAEQLSGKALSYNNIMDADGALEIVKNFDEIAVAVIKHANPCGCAIGKTLKEAYINAHACDPVSAFGSIVAMNRQLDMDTAKEIADPEKFIEVVIAPEFGEGTVEVLTTSTKWGKNVRLLRTGELPKPSERSRQEFDLRKVVGGLLLQDRDLDQFSEEGLKVVSKRQPTEAELEELKFAWTVVRCVKSNAIVISKGFAGVGVGAGQMSRVDSSKIAAMKAGDRAKGGVLASDAFFPFPDAVEAAAEAGVTAIIEPGGSMRDKEVIAACDKHDIALVFTGMRHFKH
jgi:phosphoribosylaminoimidazolecarboxamide formyltransferase/IMP cyclohydrolase